MSNTIQMAAAAALPGGPARAKIVTGPLDGRGLTVGEPVFATHVSPRPRAAISSGWLTPTCWTVSERVVTGSIGWPRRLSGRCRTGSWPASAPVPDPARLSGGEALHIACTYDDTSPDDVVSHRMIRGRSGRVASAVDGGEVTGRGLALLRVFAEPGVGKRPFGRPWLNWNERRGPIKGRLGAALASSCGGVHARAASGRLPSHQPRRTASRLHLGPVFRLEWIIGGASVARCPPEPRLSLMQRRRAPRYRWHL